MREFAQQADRGWLERIFIENYPLKLLALGFAIALFSVVHSDQDAQRSMYLDVVALLPPANADKVLVSTLPARVKITLRGSRSRLAALEHDDFAPVQMDLRDPSKQYYRFNPGSIGVSGPFRVVAIEPSSVSLTWRPRAEVSLPVHVKMHGTPQPGFMVRRPVMVTPGTIDVSGPDEEVHALTEVSTEEISVDGLGPGVHERHARLEALSGHVMYADQNSVTVRLEVDAEQSERIFPSLEVAVVGPGDVSLRPASVQVTLRGPSRALAGMSVEQLVPYVEPGGDGAPGSVQALPVKLKGVPDGCTAAQIVPDSVMVRHPK